MEWSISPTAGATINDSGVATFSANGTFTITYTDSNGCTGSTTYTVSGCGGGKTNVNISLGCSLNSSNTTLTVTATADRSVDTTVTVSTTISATLKNSGGGTFTSSQGLDITIDSGHSSGSNTINADDFWGGVSYVSASSSIDSFSPSSSSSQDYIKGSGCSASGGGGSTKRVEIRYTVQFKNIEKGSVDVTLKVPNENINISVVAGGASNSGKTTGIAKFDVDSSWTDEQILAAIDFDLPNMVATLRHEITNYDMRWNGSCLSCDIPDSQCYAFNPWPDICGPCKVCAAVNYGIEIENIAMTVTGGMCEW